MILDINSLTKEQLGVHNDTCNWQTVCLSDQLSPCNWSEMMFESFTIQHPYRAGTMEVVPAADYATAKLEALDCRTCRHLSATHQKCLSELRCEGGDQYQRQGKLMLWFTADLQGRGF